jgi:hypothetical protein
MMRMASKRKEQDTDFEEKKMHLSLQGAGGARGISPSAADDEDPDLAAYTGGGYIAGASPKAPVKKEREREEYYRHAER